MKLQGHPYSLYAESSLQSRGGTYALLGVIAAILGLAFQNILSDLIARFLSSGQAGNTYVLILGAWGSIFTTLIVIFDRWGWKLPVISDFVFLISPKNCKPPNIGGKYNLHVSWNNITKKREGESLPRALISQRWSTLSVRFEFPKQKENQLVFRASSSSDMASLSISHDNKMAILKYTFEYSGRGESLASRQKTYNGTALLHFSITEAPNSSRSMVNRIFQFQKCQFISGTFYTDYDEFGVIEACTAEIDKI